VPRHQAEQLLADRDDPVFELVSREWLETATQRDPATIDARDRHGLERGLDLAAWLDVYRPEVRTSGHKPAARREVRG
jgi:asparagine synthase (glutamine-hydrolysing)